MFLHQAIFRTLSTAQFHSHPNLPSGVLYTGKGFPDLATQELLSMINNVNDYRHNLTTPIPIFCLVDDDPYGVTIYGIYKFGGGEKSSVIERERLALPELKYLGIKSGDFEGDDDDGIISLTQRDRRRIELLLQKDWVQREPDVL